MSRAINTSLATIQFQVNARQASAAMQALQNMSNDLNREIDKVKKNIKNLGEGVPKDNPDLLNYQNQLSALDKQLKDVQKAQRDFLKGAKAADQLWKAAQEGNIESLSFRSIKAGINGLKKRQEGLSPGDAQDMKDWRIIKEVIDEADRVVKQAGADVQNVVQTIREGGKVSEQTMRQTINTLKELKGSVDETDAEYRTYGTDLDFMEAKLQEFSDAQRRAKGEIVDANDARREMNKLTEEGRRQAEFQKQQAEWEVKFYEQKNQQLEVQRQKQQAAIDQTKQQMDAQQQMIEQKHSQLAADEESFNKEQQTRHTKIDGIKQEARTARDLADEKKEIADEQIETEKYWQHQLNETGQKITDIKTKLEELRAAKLKPQVDTSEIEKLEAELARLKRELEGVRSYREAAEAKKEAAQQALGGKDIWENERYIKAREEDVAASQAAVKKLDDKWDAYWSKQEDNAKKFAEVLKKSLEDVTYEDFQKHVTGPNAELAKSWYRKTTRDNNGLEIWTDNNQKGRDIKYFRDNKKLGLATPEQLEELKLLEGLKRKWDEYWKARDKADGDRSRSNAVFDELDKYKTESIRADVAIEAATKKAVEIKQQIVEKEKQIAEAKQQNVGINEAEVKSAKEAVDVMLKAKKAEKELTQAEADRKDYVELQERRNELLKQYGITVADVTDETKLQAAAEKVVKQEEEARLEIAEKELAIRKEIYADAMKDKDLMGKKTKRDDDFAQELADYFGYDLSEKGSLADINQALNDVAQGDSEEKAEFKEEIGMTVGQAIKNLNSHIHDIVKERIEKGMDISEFAEMEDKEGDTHPISELIQPYVEQIDAAMDEYVNDKIDQLEQFDNLLDAKGESREVKIVAAKKDLVGLGTTGDGQSFADRIKGLDDLVTKYKEEIATGEALMKSKKELTEGDKELAEAETQLSEKVGALSSAQRSAQAFDMRFNVPKGYTKPTTFTDEDNAADIFTKMQAAGRPFSKEAGAARNSLRDYLQNIIDTAPDAQQKLEHLKEVFVKLSDGQEPMWVKDVDMALKKINIPELQQQAEDAYNKVIDLRQKSTQVQEQSNEKTQEELDLEQELTDTQEKNATAQKNLNDAKRDSAKATGEYVEANKKAEEQEGNLAKATKEADDAQVKHDEHMKEGLDTIGKMGEEYEGMKTKLEGQEQALADTGKQMAETNQHITDSEAKKQQAQQLTIKRMEEMLAALRKENNEVIPANTDAWRENEAEINRLSGALEKLKETARIDLIKTQGAEALKFFNDKNAAGLTQADTASAAETAEKVKALQAYRDVLPKDTDAAVFERIDEILKEQAKLLKETTGEWMSYEDAKELASKAGGDGFLATTQQMQQAVQAMERQRDSLIKTIQLKQKDGKATADEEAKLETLEKELKDLKFEQDNFNMSREKMEALMKTPVNATSIDELRAAIKRADAELKRMEGSLGQNNAQYKAFAEQVRNAKNQLKEMEGQAKASATAWEKAWSRLKTYVVMYMGFNAVWQKMVGTADDLMELSDKMGEVRKTTGFTADEVGRLSDNLAKLDTRTDLTGLMEFSSLAGSIGMKTQEQVQGFTEAANMLAVSLPEMGNEASRTLMKIADATGDLEKNGGNVRETLERVGSTIIALRANSAAAAGPITDFVSRVGAVGAQAGISIDQIAALGATVDALGGRVEMSATALSRMIPAIKNNTFEVAKAIGMTEKELKNMTGMEQMVAIFRKLHDSAKGFDTSTEEGMNAMADSVEKALGRSVSMQDVMKQLNQQGARAGIVFGLLSQNVDKLEEQLDTASEAYSKNEALMNEYNKMNDTTAAKLEKLKNYLEELFVGDSTQRLLGGLIDGLRTLVEFLADSGPIAKGLRYIGVYLALLKSKWAEAFGKGVLNTIDFFKDFSENMEDLGESVSGLGSKILPAITSVKGLKAAWKGLNAEMKANIISAVATAIAYLGSVLWDWHQAAKEAAEEQARFNDEIAEEQKALKNLMEPLKSSNLAQEERSKLISEINSKYGKYLGYMLSETSTAIQLADAHALIAKRIKEEAYQRRLAEQESKVRESYESELNSQYGTIISRVRSGRRGEADVTEIADILKAVVTNNISKYNKQQGFTSPYGDDDYWIDPKMKELIDNTLTRLNADGKVWGENLLNIKDAVYRYAQSYGNYHGELMRKTGDIRSDLRTINTSIKTDLTNNLNGLVGRIINFGKKMQTPSPVPAPAPGSSSALTPVWQQGNNGSTGWGGFPWNPKVQHSEAVQMPAPGWKLQVNEKNIDEVRQFVEDQDNLRNFLKDNAENISEQSRATAEAYLVSENELKRLRKLLPKENGGGGGGGNNNPYGDYNKVTSPYSQWNGDDLVARRKEMLERVRALANGADVQKVLSEDAKFISDAVRKNIKTTSDAIEWYNTERLKIQEALHAKHLTNTGDWLDPKKSAKRASRVVNDEMKYYLDELDAYYTERKAKIEEARNDEQITEAEAWRRTIKNENEWQQRRAELQMLYSKRRSEVTEQSENAILDIISERTGESTDFIKKDIAQTYKFILDVGNKSKAAMDRIFGDLDLGVEKSFLKSAQAIGKQMKFIEDTLAKERPYDGITKNLQENLDKMGILAAQHKRINDELEKQGKEPKYSNQEITAQTYKEMAFFLRQAEEAWSIDIDELLRRMAEEGMVATAEEISKSEMLKQAVMGQLRKTFEEVQNAVKKEASQIKKDVDIIWNDDTMGIGGMSMKATFDKAIARLGMQQDSVSRANSLIGAGAASDNVAARLAMKQIEMQMRMQKAQFDMYRVQANQRMDALKREAAEHRRLAALAEKDHNIVERDLELLKAGNAERDAANVKKSLGLTLAEETKKEEESIANLLKLQEESQNRLYTSLREWADLLASSLQGVFEASHAGDAEYYNELAKMRLTGKGGPGAGTYIVIDNEGTEDATAHYEYLNERQALERQHEIEIENARAEAWRKLMDDINMKFSETITDQLNAMLQNEAIDANTAALLANTEALYASMGATTPEGMGVGEDGVPNALRRPEETSGDVSIPKAPWQMTEEDIARGQENMNTMWQNYAESGIGAMQTMNEAAAEMPGSITPPWQISEEGMETGIEKMKTMYNAQADAHGEATNRIITDEQARAKATGDAGKQEVKSTKSSFAAMTAAANMYGIAYQTMANDNLDTTQKVEMMIVQAAGQAAISMLTASLAASTGETAANAPSWISKTLKELGPIGGPVAVGVFTALIGGLMGLATSKIAKSKSQIAQVTGASIGAGRLATGMLTYAEGNVNEFSDPNSLTPGRHYNVDGADGKTYRAKYMGEGAKTHITSGPEFHLVGEKGREAIIDAHTTRNIQLNEPEIWGAIKTLYNGGSLRHTSTRRGRGVRAFADGNVGDFEEVENTLGTGSASFDPEMLVGFQQSLDRNSAIMEQIAANGIEAFVSPYGPRGVVAGYDKAKKEAMRHGEKYL